VWASIKEEAAADEVELEDDTDAGRGGLIACGCECCFEIIRGRRGGRTERVAVVKC
jgi:hypothetical protein